MTKEYLISMIKAHFKNKDVGIDILMCLSEEEDIEQLAEQLLDMFSELYL